jgi:NAD(P)-dependent dehydrogenase (short-subunit alcohol dehydrogenase family)
VPDSIDAFAEQFLRDNEKLHILVNNAVIMAPPLASALCPCIPEAS